MKLSHKIFFSILCSLIIDIFQPFHSSLPVALSQAFTIFIVIFGAALLLSFSVHLVYWITKNNKNYPDKKVFLICLILVTLLITVSSMNMARLAS